MADAAAAALDISIHALREEGDRDANEFIAAVSIFLSTPSARRATPTDLQDAIVQALFLSTPSARRATNDEKNIEKCLQISIHALREEGDSFPFSKVPLHSSFLSTPSARRATC